MAARDPSTRQDLLEAGWSALEELRFADLLPSARSLAGRAGRSTGALFHHFCSVDHFARVLAQDVVVHLTALADEVHEMVESLTDMAAVHEAAEVDWGMAPARLRTINAQALLWALRDQRIGTDTSVTGGDLIARYYRHHVERSAEVYARVLSRVGREPAPPFDLVDLAVAVIGLAEGMQLHALSDTGLVRHGIFGDATTALVSSMTRPVARVGPRRAGEGRSGHPREQAAPLEDPVLAAAAELFAKHRLEEVSLAAVATAAGVATGDVMRRFTSVEQLAAAVAAQQLRHLPAASEPGVDAFEALEESLTRVAGWACSHRQLAKAYLDAWLDPQSGATATSGGLPAPGSVLLGLVGELRGRRVLSRRFDVDTLADTLVVTVLVRVLARPQDGVDRVATEVADLLLSGARTGID